MRLSTLSLENINCISLGKGLLDVSVFIIDIIKIPNSLNYISFILKRMVMILY